MSIVKVLCQTCGEPIQVDLSKITCGPCCERLEIGNGIPGPQTGTIRWFDREHLDMIKCGLADSLDHHRKLLEDGAGDGAWLKKLHAAAVALVEIDTYPPGIASLSRPSYEETVAEVGALLESRGIR